MTKQVDLAQLLIDAQTLLKEAKKRCKNHPDRRAHNHGLCTECWNEKRARRIANKAGFRYIDSKGYTVECLADGSTVYAHRKIFEQHNGRTLEPFERVVFRDGNKRNLDPSNLRSDKYIRVKCPCGCEHEWEQRL